MSQMFKSVYFPTHPAEISSQRHLKVAFGAKDADLYQMVKNRSSEEIRRFLGVVDYIGLQQYAAERHLSLNKACILLLREALRHDEHMDPSKRQFADPLLATYRGGDGYLFHHWYPLLEGFSPRFVEAVLDKFAPESKVVLDPFGGAGTAPLTVAQLGKEGLYCELNPVLQFVTQTKRSALKLKFSDREKLASTIRNEALALPFHLGSHEPDAALSVAYNRVFQESRYFDDETMRHVLQLRSYADKLDQTSPLLCDIFTVAVLASLVPASLMKRAGDLRYKTEDELKGKEFPIYQGVSKRLERMATDLEQAEDAVGDAALVSEDVRSLEKLPSLNVEAVVTSPPYLNGTNYVRNVKLELWFLRALKRPQDLSFWRLKAVTGGINDVTKGKCDKEYPNEVLETVKLVSQTAYDSRIPMMVGTYFADMQRVFQAMSPHLKPGSTVAIDIGDSRYGGVHVETDRLLCDIAVNLGYRHVESHLLRLRKSRDGGVLSQSLLVFEHHGKPSRPHVEKPQLDPTIKRRWNAFKRDLPHQQKPFSKRNWGHPLHSLCSYEGKMKPSLARFLTDTFVPAGGSMMDPFAGVGTIPFEACLQGKTAIAMELSPAAYAITRGKLLRSDPIKVRRILASLSTFLDENPPSDAEIESTKLINFNKTLDQFYHSCTLNEILSARRFFQQSQDDSREQDYVLACLLHILHGNRPYALSRNSHSITPFAPTGPTEYRSLMDRLVTKVERGLQAEYPPESVDGEVFFQDSTLWWPHQIDNLDAIITSPPFFDSTRFYLGNWIRLWFCGWEKQDFSSKPLHFLESRQKKSMRAYEGIFRQSRERLKPGGLLVLHLGKSNKSDMASELRKVAKFWFNVCDIFEENVTHTESHGVRDKGRVTGHQFLILS